MSAASRFLFPLLCVFGLLLHAARAADAPAQAKHYSFELHTLNMGEQLRRGGVKFNINDGMTEDELDAVNKVLDDAGAAAVDAQGFRELTLANGTHLKIGGFLVEGFVEDSVEGVQSLPVEMSAKDEFSATEAALVLQLAKAGNLFVSRPGDPDVVAIPGKVADKRFYRMHKQATMTADEAALTAWARVNIPAN